MSENLDEKLQKLREPFGEAQIHYLPKGGTSLAYVGHAHVTDRLLSIDPTWTWEPFALDERGLPAMDYSKDGQPVGLWIRLTICGVTRIGYGSCLPNKADNVKELISDALRNSAMRFGVALDLWAKSDLESQLGTHDTGTHSNQNGAARSDTLPRAENAPQRTTAAVAVPPQQERAKKPLCSKCGGEMWDNQAKKASGEISAKSPDFKCKDKDGCGHAIWLDSVKPAPPAVQPVQDFKASRDEAIVAGAREYDAADDGDPFGEPDGALFAEKTEAYPSN